MEDVQNNERVNEQLIVSKQRVADHGEVFTPAWLVEAMLDPCERRNRTH